MTTFETVITPYRIKRSEQSRFVRRWQSEAPEICRFARRAYRPRRAAKRMAHDVAVEVTGGRGLYQRYRWWKARKWDRDNLPLKDAGRRGIMSIRPIFAWYDLWIGVFIDRAKARVYIFPLPCLGVVVTRRRAS